MNKVIFSGPDAEELADMLQARLAGHIDCYVVDSLEESPSKTGEDFVWIVCLKQGAQA